MGISELNNIGFLKFICAFSYTDNACSKALRRGELYENSDSQFKLKQEIGDVYAMIDLLVEWDVLSWDEIEEQRNKKREKLKKWSDLI